MNARPTIHPAAVARLHRIRLAGAPAEGDPRHGTDTGYAAGCREQCCRTAHARRRKLDRMRPNPLIDVIGTRRRVEALACLGWSAAEQSRMINRTSSYLRKAVASTRTSVQVETALIVADLYERLCMTRCTGPYAARTAAEARARGWVPPLTWDRIDDPTSRPRSGLAVPDVDPDVLAWITLEGRWEFARGAARPMRDAVRAWWSTTGRPYAELERLTGWNVARDQRHDAASAVAS